MTRIKVAPHRAAHDANGGNWVTALYWTCWLLLAVVVVVLFLRW